MSTDPMLPRVGDTTPIFATTDAMPVVTVDSPTPSQNRGRGRLPLIIGAVVVVAALVVGLVAAAMRLQQSALATPDPAKVAQAYCADLTGQNYAKAYGLFTRTLQQLGVSATTYTSVAGILDTQQGKATACVPAKATVAKDGKTAVAPLVVTRANAGEAQADLHLTLQKNVWLIADSPDAALLPYTTEYAFCQALIASPPDTATMYALFSAKFQQTTGSAHDLEQSLDRIEQITGPATQCDLQGMSLGPDGQSGTFDSGTTFKNFSNVPTQLKMSADTTGAWKIDAVIIKVAGFPLQLPFNGLGG